MALPANLSTCTFTGRFIDSLGNPASGNVIFRPAPPIVLDPTSSPPVSIVPTPVVVRLDANGDINAVVPATNDADVNPTGWTYEVKLHIVGEPPRIFNVVAPAGQTINLATVIPANFNSGIALVVGPQGPPFVLDFVQKVNDTLVFDFPDLGIDTSATTGREFRPKVGAVWFGDGEEVPAKWHLHGAVNIFEINDSPELIGRRSPGQFVDGGTVAATTLAASIANINIATSIGVANAFNGSVTFPNSGKIQLQDATGSGVAKVAYTSVDRVNGVFSGLTVEYATQTAWDIGDKVYGVIVDNTNLLMLYGQADMGRGGFQDRSAQIAFFTAEDHIPDGRGGYFSAGYRADYTSSPGPNSQRRHQGTLDERGFYAYHGSGQLDHSTMSATTRFTVAPVNTRLNGAISLPAATIPVLDPSGFPTSGSFNVTSDAGSQTVTYTGYSANLTTGSWEFTGCAGGTGTAANQAFVQIPTTASINVIGAIRGNIVAHVGGTNNDVGIGKFGPTSADPEAALKLGGSSGAVTIYRGASGEAWTSNIFRFLASGTTPAWKIHVAGEAEPRFAGRVGGPAWGPGGSTAVDVIIARTNAIELGVRDAANANDGDFKMARARITGPITHTGTTIGFNSATPTAKSTGWGAPTGTTTKTTFDTATVTTAQLAERVKGLIDYLTLRGDIGA